MCGERVTWRENGTDSSFVWITIPLDIGGGGLVRYLPPHTVVNFYQEHNPRLLCVSFSFAPGGPDRAQWFLVLFQCCLEIVWGKYSKVEGGAGGAVLEFRNLFRESRSKIALAL